MSPPPPRRRCWRRRTRGWSPSRRFRAATTTPSPPGRSRRGGGRCEACIPGEWAQPSPVGVVVLHDAQGVPQLESAFEGAGEGAERLAVRVAGQQPVLLPPPLALAGELESRAVAERDRRESPEAHRAGLRGLAVHPQRALGASGGIVDSA